MTQLEMRRLLGAQNEILKATEAVKREKAILARVVEQSSDFIGMADPEGRVFFLNDAAREMVGLDETEIATTNVVDYFHEDDRATILDDVMPRVARDGFWEGELRFRNFATREVVPVLYNIFSMKDDN